MTASYVFRLLSAYWSYISLKILYCHLNILNFKLRKKLCESYIILVFSLRLNKDCEEYKIRVLG
jgi:hypothetical protein